ncbi:MAG: hypothetical protein ACR2PX_19385 [Endozoicomonas sp.]|uniref:hypothetical protein n=1 Tax=Endozoicomonas sp. TaxID=1892382 RepID=UPI003D9B49DB
MEVAQKVRDTLAGLVAAKFNANDFDEKKLAKQALSRSRLKVVLHLEQPSKSSKLRPQVIDPAVAKQKLKQYLKAIDAHPVVMDKSTLSGKKIAWQVDEKDSSSDHAWDAWPDIS